MPPRRVAFGLLFVTIAYNVAEGLIAIWAGIASGSLVLLAFGADSYLEVAAATAVVARLSFRDAEAGERAEGRALRFIGATFLLLAAGVAIQALVALNHREGADESYAGLSLLMASLVIMPLLAFSKLRVAARLQMPVLAAEARETVACAYLSLTALAGILATALFGTWWLDPLAALLMIPWLVKEGLEGLRGVRCAEESKPCFCRPCWWGLRTCTDLRV